MAGVVWRKQYSADVWTLFFATSTPWYNATKVREREKDLLTWQFSTRVTRLC